MIALTSKSHILLAREPADFRRGIDGFQALCRTRLQQEPKQDVWFVFFNRSRTQVRILRYDNNGFWLMNTRCVNCLALCNPQRAVAGSGRSPDRKPKKQRSEKSRQKAPETAPTVVHHTLDDLQKGDSCPVCETGKVYK